MNVIFDFRVILNEVFWAVCSLNLVGVSSDESKLKPVIEFYPRFCNVWFKEYLVLTRGEACFVLLFYYTVIAFRRDVNIRWEIFNRKAMNTR